MRVVFGWRVAVSRVPWIEVLQDLFDCRAGLGERRDPRSALTVGTAKRIDLAGFLDEPRPAAVELFGRRFSGSDGRRDGVGSRLFAHAPGLVGIVPDASGELFASVRNMDDKTREPVEGVEVLYGLSIF